MENQMKRLGYLGAAALLASALATPAMAQQVVNRTAQCAQYDWTGNCQTMTTAPGTAGYQRGATYQDRDWRAGDGNRWDDSYARMDDDRWDSTDTGFWPGDVAAGVVGGAIGTAERVVTAPMGGTEYARRNGFVCIPGTLFRGEDGRQHLCQ
jgi:hypothetical protein